MDGESLGLIAIFLPHVVGGIFLGWRLLPRGARDELRGWWRSDGGDGGQERPGPGRGPRDDADGAVVPPDVPLPTAGPASTRLREPGRLADRVPGPSRRPAHPADPTREPVPTRERDPTG
ncbi:MAG: hypothetical protein AB7G37_18215 [Solirubrobacteraceae bacterium]